MTSDKKEPQLSFAETFTLAGVAAVISKTAAAPIERVKLLVQSQDEMIKAGRLDGPYKGVIDCTIRTYKSEGILPFWRSNFTNCVRYFPTQALNFAFNDKIKAAFRNNPNESYGTTFAKYVFSGGTAGALSLCFVYSMDYARTRLANDAARAGAGTSERQFSGLIDVYRQTLKSDGIVGLYRGFVISCWGIIVYRGFYFGLYDSLKPILLSENANIFLLFALGYGATIVAELLSYPLDTIRRRMMMTSGEAVKYKGSIDCLVQILRHEGFMSTMKGAWANILRGVSSAGVLAGFDKFKALYIQWRLAQL